VRVRRIRKQSSGLFSRRTPEHAYEGRARDSGSRGWERWVNPGDLGLRWGLHAVYVAYAFHAYARLGGGALTLAGESGLIGYGDQLQFERNIVLPCLASGSFSHMYLAGCPPIRVAFVICAYTSDVMRVG
jgi:hypothetical protein